MVEWRRAAERDQQEQQPDAAQPPHQASTPIAESENRERDYRKTEVFGVELERVGSPVTAAERIARETGYEELRDMVPRYAVRGRPGVTHRVAAGAWRVRDVLEEREQLRHPQTEARDNRGERQREPLEARSQRLGRRFPKRQVQRKQPRRDQQIVRRLHVWAQQTQPHRDGQEWIAPPAPVPQRHNEREECEGQ